MRKTIITIGDVSFIVDSIRDDHARALRSIFRRAKPLRREDGEWRIFSGFDHGVDFAIQDIDARRVLGGGEADFCGSVQDAAGQAKRPGILTALQAFRLLEAEEARKRARELEKEIAEKDRVCAICESPVDPVRPLELSSCKAICAICADKSSLGQIAATANVKSRAWKPADEPCADDEQMAATRETAKKLALDLQRLIDQKNAGDLITCADCGDALLSDWWPARSAEGKAKGFCVRCAEKNFSVCPQCSRRHADEFSREHCSGLCSRCFKKESP